MKKYDVVFCVLTYKNYIDLEELIHSIIENVKVNYRIIVVNNFADEESLRKIENIAKLYACDFIESKNKGYGYGNNKGISFALRNYLFRFIIICNPDVIIKCLDFKDLEGKENKIIAPEIICLNGKKQNPAYFSYSPIIEKIVYFALNRNTFLIFYIGMFLNKANRIINNYLMELKLQKIKSIYMCHGSFIVFGSNCIKKLFPVFDENLFLFSEEYDLAKNVSKKNIVTEYNKNVVIFHKEDGSIRLEKINLKEMVRKSYLYYYNKWSKKS